MGVPVNASRVGIGGPISGTRFALGLIVLTVLTAAIVAGALVAGYRVAVLVAIVAFVSMLGTPTRVVAAMVLLAPNLALLRRVLSGDSGRIDFDPIGLFPAIVALILIVFYARSSSQRSSRFIPAILSVLIFLIFVSVAFALPLDTDAIYDAFVFLLAILLIILTSSGRLRVDWRSIEPIFVFSAVIAATYGIVQFFVLPDWDLAWMNAVEMQSLGAAAPMELRVFGGAESPGVYALFLGSAVTLALVRLSSRSTVSVASGWVLFAGLVGVSLALTAVRATLVAVALVAVVLILFRARGFARIVLLAIVVAASAVVIWATDTFGATSQVLSVERYSDLSDDRSVGARIEFYSVLVRPMDYLVGNPAQAPGDGMIPDVVVRYGYLAGVLFAMFVVYAIVMSFRRVALGPGDVLGAISAFALVHSFAGDVFGSTTGLLLAMVVGSALASLRRQGDGAAPGRPVEAALSGGSR